MVKKAVKKVKANVLTFCTLVYVSIITLLPSNVAFAANDANDAWSKAGVTKSGSIKNSNIYKNLQDIVYLLIAIGAIWTIAWIVIGGMLLAGSNGNPQKRTAGIAAILTAGAGGWVIYKAWDIGGYIAGFGAS